MQPLPSPARSVARDETPGPGCVPVCSRGRGSRSKLLKMSVELAQRQAQKGSQRPHLLPFFCEVGEKVLFF